MLSTSTCMISCDKLTSLFKEENIEEKKEEKNELQPSDDTSDDNNKNEEKEAGTDIESINLIELDKRGFSDNSAFDNSITLLYGSNNTAKYDITCSLEEEDDSDFFTLSSNSSSTTITAKDSSRFTYLNVTYRNKGSSTIVKTVKKILLSNTINFSHNILNFSEYGEDTFNANDYVSISFNRNNDDYFFNIFSSSNNKYDLVFPPKLKINDEIKEVATFIGRDSSYYCRNLFVPETIFYFGSKSFPFLTFSNYLYFQKSKKGYLYFHNYALVNDDDKFTSYFLLENQDGNIKQCRFFAGPSYYYFPYTTMGKGGDYTGRWQKRKVEYSSWDWQTNFVNLYNTNSKSYFDFKKSFKHDSLCFR